MDSDSGRESFACTVDTVLLTPKSEVAECDVLLSPGVEVKYEECTEWPKESGFLRHVIIGQPVLEFDWGAFNIYICSYEAYQVITNCIPDCSNMKSGAAHLHLFAGSRCHFVVELQNDYSFPQISSMLERGRKIMWFAVQKCSFYLIDKVVRDKLRYLNQSLCFQSGVGINLFNDADASLHHQRQMIVNVIAADEVEFKSIFPGKCDHFFCMESILLNALKVSSSIRICTTSRNEKTEELLNALSVALHNFYQRGEQNNGKSLLHVPSAETVTSRHGCEDSGVDGVHTDFSTTEVKSVLEVDNNWLADMKSNIEAVSQPKPCNKKHQELPADVNPMPRISVERRLLLECPLCGMPFRSCKNRYQSLVSHIKRRHSHCEKRLLRIVHKKYVVDS
ncbi:Nonribosomal peptide synthetase 9 [Frankliniella fusca]|uniref:Nonribosomal peptide synthetase 9 n=1 Tax=Frankliniella fusca TaxID=407009 RepID=A0AAE1HLB8_9NEOP|nr:Nonribosomal peptide synthetase 9 [Frankliniella fusca]